MQTQASFKTKVSLADVLALLAPHSAAPATSETANPDEWWSVEIPLGCCVEYGHIGDATGQWDRDDGSAWPRIGDEIVCVYDDQREEIFEIDRIDYDGEIFVRHCGDIYSVNNWDPEDDDFDLDDDSPVNGVVEIRWRKR